MTWLLVGVGGALGSMARHGVNHLVQRVGDTFPLGILIVNVSGSTVIGLVAGLLAAGRLHLEGDARLFVIVGLLGGFTTFSSFSLDTLALARSGHYALAAWNVAGQVALSLLGVSLGYWLGRLGA